MNAKPSASPTIDELLVVDGHAENPPNETKVIQVMFVAEPRVGINLESVVVTR